MTKKQLVAYIEEAQKKRAFDYEDQIKLMILDEAPFTIWTSDRNCIIKLWMGQCEKLYGYSKEEAVGKDFVDLFVADDEKAAARKDQIKIIDDNEIFHNLANDVAENANTLQLITYCRRIQDPLTGEYWNAEMGVVIDFLEKEKQLLQDKISESRKIKSSVDGFMEDIRHARDLFSSRKRLITEAMKECEIKATGLRKRTECKKRLAEIRARLSDVSQKLEDISVDHISSMQSSFSLEHCSELRESFFNENEKISELMDEMALDVYDISCDYDVNQNLVSEKDSLMKNLAYGVSNIRETINELLRKVEQEMEDYKKEVTPNPNTESSPYKEFLDIKEIILLQKNKLEKFADEKKTEILSASTRAELKEIQDEMQSRLKIIKEQIEVINR
ncbi:MAG: PAS domain-containing protein [Candidatus Gastranaerophilales bacterium]|nr:PAS domain-containing protein [Candidatus Gastranaerophilales bacterium]